MSGQGEKIRGEKAVDVCPRLPTSFSVEGYGEARVSSLETVADVEEDVPR